MKILHFSEYDNYEQLKKAINLSLQYDFVDDTFLKTLTYKDPNFNENDILIAIEDNEIISFIFGVERIKEPREKVEEHKEIMWIKAFGVLYRYKNRGILDRLFKEFEEYVKEKLKKVIRISDYASWYLTPGVDNLYDYYNKFLVTQGYRRLGSTVNYEIDMSRFYIPTYVYDIMRKKFSEKDIYIINIKNNIDKKTLDWIEEHFSVFWKIEAKIAMENNFGGVLIAINNDKILGFSTYGSLHPSWFGPIGVSKEARGLGIGTVLLFKTLEELKANGQRIVTIPWTSHLFYYTQLPGIMKIRHFNIYVKEIIK